LSSMFSISHWEHERILSPKAGGTAMTDRVTFKLKWPFSAVPFAEQAVGYAISKLFDHRHRRIARWFTEMERPRR
jgi:ligand-binding SRPBCC domain-containing protein